MKSSVGQFEKSFPSGAKAPNHFGLFMYGLKPVPLKLGHRPQMNCNAPSSAMPLEREIADK
jgi:hypothetical protein